MATTPNTYRRADGVEGVGFEIDFAGRRQHSVAWPDRPAERFTADELERKRVRCTTADEPAKSHQTPPVDVNEPTQEPESQAGEQTATEGPAASDTPPIAQGLSEAEAIRRYLTAHPDADNDAVIRGVAEHGYEVQASQVSRQRNKLAK